MGIANNKSNMDKRINDSRPYSGHIYFVAKDGFGIELFRNRGEANLRIIK